VPVGAVSVLAGIGLTKLALKTKTEKQGDSHDWTQHRI